MVSDLHRLWMLRLQCFLAAPPHPRTPPGRTRAAAS
jgi:hypothetical protein